MKSPATKDLALHFDARGGSYWLRLDSGEFLPLDTGQAKLHLRATGLNPDTFTDGLNEVERALWVSQKERHVHYAGPLAGWPTGSFITPDGRRCLVTSAARRVVPKQGQASAIEGFFCDLLGDQAAHFLNWLALSLRALESASGGPGQLCALAGPSGCGKSLAQTIITAVLGGRCASPYNYMTGETSFNSDLAQAEHWAIEDKASSTDIRTRRKFGASIKEACVNRELCVHAKGRQAITLPTFRRLTLSVNDEPENLMILPPLDESILDKVNLYHCSPADVGEDRAKTWKTFTDELPAFVWQLNKLTIAKSWKCPRYGQKAFHAPALLEVLNAAAPETRLLTLIDETLFSAQGLEVWTGSAEQLEKELRASPFCFAVEKLLYFSSASGVYLSRLAAKHPERVSATRASGKTRWTLSKAAEQ